MNDTIPIDCNYWCDKIPLFCQCYVVINDSHIALRCIRCFCSVSLMRHARNEETKVTLACWCQHQPSGVKGSTEIRLPTPITRGFIVEERVVHTPSWCIIRHSRSVAFCLRTRAGIRWNDAERDRRGNGNQRRRQTWAIIGRYVLLLITIMTAKPGRGGYRVRSHGWSACRVHKRCIHLIGIHAASKFLASTCYLSLFLPVPSSLRPLAPLCLSAPVSIFPWLISLLERLSFSLLLLFQASLLLRARVRARARLRACVHKIFSGAPFLIKETARSQFR